MSDNSNSIGLNELVDYKKKDYKNNFRKYMMKFLWKCAGADSQILQYAPYSDHIKNAGIGGVVLATSVMAALAMGFAMHTIFGENIKGVHHGNWMVTIPVAIVWGLIIFNLDRFIVSTVKGDGTEKITLGEWGAMLPRLFMAIIIGLTISAPLETHIFEKEITREWSEVQFKKSQNRADEVEGIYFARINEIKAKVLKNDSIYRSNKIIFDSLSGQINDLQAGVGIYIGQACLKGEICQRHGAMYKSKNKAEEMMNEAKTKNDDANLEQTKLLAEKDSVKKEQMDSIRKQLPGFLDQLMMLENLSSHGETFNPIDPVTKKPQIDPKTKEPVMEELYGAAWAPIWLVRLLFMIVEIAPVIFKFMIWKSSYDYMQDNVSQILESKQGISLEVIPTEEGKLYKIKENYNARRIVEVSKRQNELEKENAIHAITLYAEKEREEIEKDPGKFVQPTDPSDPNNPTT